MSRVINTANPGKLRNQARRTIAEILRHLMLKRDLDEETKDLAAAIVFALRDISKSIEVTTTAWEKRNYFVKADRFRLEWEWTEPTADQIEKLVLEERWEELPMVMSALVPRFGDIRIAKMTRKPSTWHSAFALLQEEAQK